MIAIMPKDTGVVVSRGVNALPSPLGRTMQGLRARVYECTHAHVCAAAAVYAVCCALCAVPCAVCGLRCRYESGFVGNGKLGSMVTVADGVTLQVNMDSSAVWDDRPVSFGMGLPDLSFR